MHFRRWVLWNFLPYSLWSVPFFFSFHDSICFIVFRVVFQRGYTENNHCGRMKCSEPIRTRNRVMWPAVSAGISRKLNRVDWLKRVAQVLRTNRIARKMENHVIAYCVQTSLEWHSVRKASYWKCLFSLILEIVFRLWSSGLSKTRWCLQLKTVRNEAFPL